MFRVMVTVVFLIRKLSMKMNFYKKNVPIEAFVTDKMSLSFGPVRSVLELDQP